MTNLGPSPAREPGVHGVHPAPGEPLRVLVAVAYPPHGASDRVRLGDLVEPLGRQGIELRPWAQPHLAVGADAFSVDDLSAILWADVVWIRRYVDETVPDPADGTPRPSGFDALLAALEADPGLLAGRPLVLDLDADLISPRPGTLAGGAAAVRAQVERLLRVADLVTVATPSLAATLGDLVPFDRLRVIGSGVAFDAYAGATRESGRVPVVAAIDTLDGPGGIERWLPALAQARAAGTRFRSVRIVDPAAPEAAGFDEVIAADEGAAAWVEALVAAAPDVVLAPTLGDEFAATLAPLAWLEGTAVGAAVIADGSANGPYHYLVDGSDARLVHDPADLPAALASLLADPGARNALADGARVRAQADGSAASLASVWAAAFREATVIGPRSGVGRSASLNRAARRAAIAATRETGLVRTSGDAASIGLVGVVPEDVGTLAAALGAAARLQPPPFEVVLAGSVGALDVARALVPDTGAAPLRLRTVPVDAGTSPATALAAAIAASTADWLGILDASAELRPAGPASLAAVVAENALDAAFGELVVASPSGDVARVGGWPPTAATFRASTLLVSGSVARSARVTPAHAELDDPVLDWVLALMEAGCRTGSAGLAVARALPPGARSTRIRSVGTGVPYADGGEDSLLGIIAGAENRSATSDELARGIRDWTSRYHLSRLRGNIVGSVAFPPGSRIVDVGAGTGTIARALGERGLHVTALEGSFDRARVAAVRCADLPTVEVIHGTAGDYENPGAFDAVVVIGVLEYSGSFQGGAAGPSAFLGRARSLLRPGGVLVLAIENRFGLKYLQGYAEDHLARPWVGIDGYGSGNGVRTWSRKALGALLAQAGFPCQRWRYPFPDYKLPTVVLDERAYRQPDGAALVDALVREPVKDYSNPRTLVRDDRGAHQGFLDAGLGEDVANSFLVIAGDDPDEVDRFAPADGPIAWLFGDERSSRWLRSRVVEDDPAGRAVVTLGATADVEACGLRQLRTPREAFVTGPTLEQELKEAVAEEGAEGGRRVLSAWVATVDAERDRSRVPGRATSPATPFSPARPREALPGGMLDVVPSNFIRTAGGGIARIDREWQLGGPIDRDLALFRALWYLAGTMIRGAWATPWPGKPPRQVAHELAVLAGVRDDDALFERFRAAEGWLQARVQLGTDAQPAVLAAP